MTRVLFSAGLILISFTMAHAQTRPLEWIAHRGESYIAPENTLASFNLAWQLGTDACETDIHLTKDGQLIICHDADTKRTAGTQLVIKDHTLEELRKLDVGSWKDPKYAGEKMPTLAEALATIPEGKRFFVEIKIGPEAVPELKRVIEASGKKPEQIVIISFHLDACAEAKKQLPAHKVYYLASFKQDKETHEWTPKVAELIEQAMGAKLDGLDLQAKAPVTAQAVAAIHGAGLEAYVWTIDEVPLTRQMISAGVDGVTTNRESWLRKQAATQPAR